jgi:prepilin-type processing-associated H-X9-DG protein
VSAAYKLLTGTKLGSLLEDLAGQYITLRQQFTPPGGRRIAPDVLIGAFVLAGRQGFAWGIWGKDPENLGWVLVVRGGERPDIRRRLEITTRPDAAPEPVQKAGRTIRALNSDDSWWIENGDLVLSNQPEAVLAVMDGKQPGSVDHPIRTALIKAEGGFEPAAVGFLDVAKLPPMSAEAVRLGLDGVRRLEFVWGFEGDAMRTVIHAAAPAPRRGLLALLDQPTFDANTLPPLPAGLTGFTVISIDLSKTYVQVADLIDHVTGNGPANVGVLEDAIRQQFGLDIRNDLVAGLGPKLALYVQRPAGGAPAGGNRATQMISGLSGLTLSAEVHDQAAISRALEPLMKVANQLLQQAGAGGGALEFRKQESARPAYLLDIPAGMLPPPFATLFRPTVVLGKDQLVIGASMIAAEQAANLSGVPADRRWKPTGAFAPVVSKLPANLVYLRLADPRETMPAFVESLPVLVQQINAQEAQSLQMRRPFGAPAPAGAAAALRVDLDKLPRAEELIPLLFPATTALRVDGQGASLIAREPIPGLTSPALGGLVIAMLVPARQAAREAARRAQCVNNFKQIALACHNYHSAINALPMPAITDKDGKPLLSWRVAILPYLEQQELYNKFKLDEPWDSPHNKPLIKELPAVYLCPSRRKPEPGTTTFRVFVENGALFENGVATGFQDVTDGTSNTVMVVESEDAVPWTKPDELKFDPEAKPSLRGAGSPHPGGFNTGFADGSVRFIKKSVSLVVWRALITRAAGEVISADAY